jgi:hypothetical protein
MGDLDAFLADLAIARQITMFRGEAGIRRKIIELLRQMEAELSAKLTTPLTQISRQRLTDMLADTRTTIAQYYIAMRDAVDLREVASIEAIGASQALQQVVSVKLTTGALTDARLRTLVSDLLIDGAPNSQWWARQGQDTAFRFANAVRQGVAQGETNAKIVGRILGRDGQPGVMEISRRNAESLVRTSIATATAAADMAVYEDEVVAGFRQLSTLDGRTSDTCKAYSGAEWNKAKEPVGKNKLPFVNPGGSLSGAPRHWSCRSRILPKVRALDVLPEFRGSTRASMDGPVAANLTFDEWLAKKPKAFQDDALGPGRADLYRDGKITLAQLLDQSGRPLTLAELRRRFD